MVVTICLNPCCGAELTGYCESLCVCVCVCVSAGPSEGPEVNEQARHHEQDLSSSPLLPLELEFRELLIKTH